MNSRDLIESQLRDCYGRVVYSHKTYEKCADNFRTRLNTIKVSQIVLSSITTGSFLFALFGFQQIGSIIGAVFSAILLALALYTKDYDLGARARKYRRVAAELWRVREEYLSVLTDLRAEQEVLENITTRRDALLDDLSSIYSRGLSTTSRAYKKAQKALQINEEMTISDDEIDQFLPIELRKGCEE